MVLVHFGDPAITRRCLEGLRRFEPFPHRVIVVDHGPGPGLEAALQGAHQDLLILPNPSNPGFGAGCNRGAQRAFAEGCEAVWFLNNDVVLDGPKLERLVTLARCHPEVGCWSHTQLEGTRRLGADLQPAWFATGQGPTAAPPAGCRYLDSRESLSGASLFLTAPQWERLGPWPEDFFLYYEDAAYSHRAHSLGVPLALLEEAVPHARGTTTGRRSPLTVFYGVRNLLLLHREIHPAARLPRLLMALNLLQKRFFQGRWRLLPPTWRGIAAAWGNHRGRDPRY